MISHLKIASLLLFVLLLETKQAKCKKYSGDDEDREKQLQGWKKSRVSNSRDRGLESEYRTKFNGEFIKNYNKGPPPIDHVALMARYIVNQADWTAVSTISSRKDIKSYPIANVIALSDGSIGNGSGIPYMFLTPLDFTAQDISKDDRASLLMTLAQGDYCSSQGYDPMDPRCARVLLSGKIQTLKNGSAEHSIAEQAMFGRHPWLAHMPPDHRFFLAKLKMAAIAVLDTFGGPKYVNVKDYLHPPVSNVTAEFLQYRSQLVSFQNLERSAKRRDSRSYESNVLEPEVLLV